MQSTQKPITQMSIQEKLNIANNIYIWYPRFKEILAALEYCHHFSINKDEPECMFLAGQTGVGKTTVYKTYASRYPRLPTQDGTQVPILAVTIPAPATVKTVVTKLLWELGDPAYDKGSVGNQSLRLIGLMKDCGVELLIFDEFQHFIDRDSAKVLKTVSDWLKNLILDTNLPIILVGLPEAEQVLRLESQSQLSRRFANRQTLHPFLWHPDQGREFRTFLHILESQLPFLDNSHLSEVDMARRIYYASDGVIAYIMKLIRYGTYLALEQQQEKLDSQILATAFDKYVRADKSGKVNPFTSDNFEVEFQSCTQLGLEVETTNGRLKTKSNKIKASNVLSCF